jgi:RNA polymerase sigma-70 factor (ECF subfamily)
MTPQHVAHEVATMDEMRAVVHGDDEAAFRRLFEQHLDAVHRYCRRRARPDDADDAVAEVFLIVWRRRHEVGSSADLPWLYATARRVLANQRRSLVRRMRLTDRLAREPVTVGRQQEPDDDIRDALTRLTERDREVIRLSLWEDLAPAEIGQVLGCSAKAASMRLSRALDRLSQRLSPQEISR